MTHDDRVTIAVGAVLNQFDANSGGGSSFTSMYSKPSEPMAINLSNVLIELIAKPM
jgi:hypothetical protein